LRWWKGRGSRNRWLPGLLDQSRMAAWHQDSGRIPCSQSIELLEVQQPSIAPKGTSTPRAIRTIYRPGNARIVARNIAEAFARLDPKSRRYH